MKKLLILLRVSARGFVRRHTGAQAPERWKGRLGKAGLAVLMLLLYGMVVGYTIALGVGLNAIGLIDVYPTMALTITAIFSLLAALRGAQTTLFRSQDFDLVLSLPVPSHTVAAARLLEFYAGELLYALLIMLPAGGVYAWFVRPAAAFYLYYALGIFLAPLLPVLVGALLGTLIQLASAAFRGSRVVSLVLTFAVTIAIMCGSYTFGFMSESYTTAQFINLANTVSGLFGRFYPPAKLFTRAVVGLDGAAFAAFAGISLAAFALLVGVFGHWFVPLHTFVTARHTRRHYELREQRPRGVRQALLWREARRYFASNLYVMNTAMGLVLSLVGVIALAVLGLGRIAVYLEIVGFERQIALAVPFLLSFMVSTATTTGSSISLEGRQLWIARALPVPALDYLMAKVRLNLLIVLPFVLVDAIILIVALRLKALAAALALLLPLVAAVFTALLGLLANLKWHRFDWVNEASVIKQSLAPFLPVLAAFLLIGGPAVLTFFVPALDHALVPLLTVLLFAALDAGMYALLRRNAEKWVEKL